MDNRIINGHNEILYKSLTTPQREFLISFSSNYRLTYQEIKKLMEFAIDLDLWNELPLSELTKRCESLSKNLHGRQKKEFILKEVEKGYCFIKNKIITYEPKTRDLVKPQLKINYKNDNSKIFGLCPVNSEKTLCCNLRTIDAVLGCGYGCSYCALKSTFDDSNIIFHKNLKEKLDKINIDPNRLYHIGTGQSSDALLWGNKDNMLDHLMEFARIHPNIQLELKTKSDNVEYLLKNKVPKNVFPSFSLNPDVVIENEEHFTATLHERLLAARKVSNHGIKIAFHFHPIFYFIGWEKKYTKIAKEIMATFKENEILFISMGTLFFPKPVLKKIRQSASKTKVYQMPLIENPEGKLTIPDETKLVMFRHVYASFKPWHKQVFFYLCMETRDLWEKLFGFSYPNNDAFEDNFLKHIQKILYESK